MLGWEPEVGAPGLPTSQLSDLQHAAQILWPPVSSLTKWRSGTRPDKWSLGAFPEWKFFGLFLITANKMLLNISPFSLRISKGRIWKRSLYICIFTALFPVLSLLPGPFYFLSEVAILLFVALRFGHVYWSLADSSDLWSSKVLLRF